MTAAAADPKRRRTRLLTTALLALAGAGLAWRIVSLGMAEHDASELDDPAGALHWNASHAGARLALGLTEGEAHPEAALAQLQVAVAANPADGQAYAALGRLLEGRGEAARARLAMETASRLAPQRSDVQQEVAAYWMRQGDIARALGHWSTVLRHRGDLRATIFPELLKLAGDPARQGAFVRLLRQSEPWWPAFFAYAARSAPDLATVRVLFNLQQGGPNAATPDMLRAYLGRLQKDGEWLEAWFVWLNSLPDGQIGKVGYLFNGSFEAPLSDLGFDWIHPPQSAVAVEAAPTYGTSGDLALRVSFRGVRLRFQHLYQYLMLPPGDFSLQGRVRPDNLEAPQGMQWALYCVGEPAPVAVSERFRGSAPWSRFRTGFSIPAEGCPVQMLRLELAGTIRLDFDATGTVWFDDLSIQKLR